MAIPAVNSTTPQSQALNSLPQKTVTQDDFLKLLITQLQNQDPLAPMDNQEFAAQLASFNSLGQLIDINQKLGGLQNTYATTNQMSATAMIGKEITIEANTVTLASAGSAKIGFQLGANAARAVVNVLNDAGVLVRQIDAGAQSAGERNVAWDGKDGSGQRLKSGLYHFEINAIDVKGTKVAATAQLRGIVTGVKLNGSEPILDVGGVDVPLSTVTGVRSASGSV